MNKITAEEVEKLGKLARLGLTTEEKENLSKQMSEVLSYVEQLDEVNTEGVEPTSQVTGLCNIYVEDLKSKAEETREELLSNAPQKENGFIKVKSVLE